MPLAPLCRALALAACLLFALPAWGAQTETGSPDAPGLAEGRALVHSGRFEEALAVLRPLAAERVVHADVLFLLGLAAIQVSLGPDITEEEREALLDEAIAALRVMLIDRPDLMRVRLELARAFFFKGEDGLARRHFEQILAGEPPPSVAVNVGRFLAMIRARRRWSLQFGAAIAPDSNIGSGSDEAIIYIQGLPFELDAEELTTSGVGVAVWGGGEYQYPLGDCWRLRTGADFSRLEYGGADFDQLFVSLHAGPRWLVDANTDVSLLADVRRRWVGTVPDYDDVGPRVEAGHRLSQRVSVNGRASWYDRRYRSRTHLDGSVTNVSLGGSWVITPTVRADASVGYGRERPETVRWRHERWRLGAGVSVILPLGFTVGGGGEYRWTDYEEGWLPFVLDGGAREDRTRSVRASVFNRGITLYGFSPEVSVVHEVRKSNAQLHGYERTRGELRFVRQF